MTTTREDGRKDMSCLYLVCQVATSPKLPTASHILDELNDEPNLDDRDFLPDLVVGYYLILSINPAPKVVTNPPRKCVVYRANTDILLILKTELTTAGWLRRSEQVAESAESRVGTMVMAP
ncbi:hypothetical protein QFC20_006876 [Naganishia adeliensis]|uniref:Uncharacterized protein n=1 Tax=Naganishia adeliensis TaxID=92952 RepID=A0ACC2V6S2_9TREE|nr:hypothetical protein QFC20_006876 [Naganishia adeliensis]